MFKTNFSGHNNIWGALPPNTTRGYGPGSGHQNPNEVFKIFE